VWVGRGGGGSGNLCATLWLRGRREDYEQHWPWDMARIDSRYESEAPSPPRYKSDAHLSPRPVRTGRDAVRVGSFKTVEDAMGLETVLPSGSGEASAAMMRQAARPSALTETLTLNPPNRNLIHEPPTQPLPGEKNGWVRVRGYSARAG